MVRGGTCTFHRIRIAAQRPTCHWDMAGPRSCDVLGGARDGERKTGFHFPSSRLRRHRGMMRPDGHSGLRMAMREKCAGQGLEHRRAWAAGRLIHVKVRPADRLPMLSPCGDGGIRITDIHAGAARRDNCCCSQSVAPESRKACPGSGMTKWGLSAAIEAALRNHRWR